MPKILNGKKFYFANEVAQIAGISKPTLLRWIATSRVKDAAQRNRNGWRLFSESEVHAISRFAQGGS